MDTDPIATLRGRAELQLREGESPKEYVRRVGEHAGLPEETIEAAVEYVIRWQYAREPPTDSEPFLRLLEAVEDRGDTAPDVTDEPTDRAAVPASGVDPTPELQPLRAERRSMRSDFKSGLRGREPRRLLLRFLVIVLTAPVLGWLIGRTWVPGHQLYDGVQAFLASALGLPSVTALELVGSFGLGLYAGLLALFLLDIKKRVQGMLLVLGSVLALGVVAAMGVFLPNLDPTWLNAVGVVGGLAVGFLVELEPLVRLDWDASRVRRPTLDDGSVPEFRRAVALLFGLVAVLLVGTVGGAVLADTIRFWDVAAAGVFLFVGYQFVGYDSETNYMVLGPARAGKTMLTLGLCLELATTDGPHPNPNGYLQRGLEQISNIEPGAERWPVASTPPDELEVASFEVVAGYYFPRRLELTALDYAGQHLERVAQLVDGEAPGGDGSVPDRVAQLVTGGDTLLVLLDVERLVFPEKYAEAGATDEANVSWGLEHYATILKAHDPDDVVVVATKCDLLIQHRGIDAPVAHDSYEAFADAVTDHLTARPDVTELLELAGTSTINPVYYATMRTDDGEYVPRLDGDGNPMLVGFGHLLAELRRRQ